MRFKSHLLILLFTCSLTHSSAVNEIVLSFDSTSKIKIVPVSSKIVRVQLSNNKGEFQDNLMHRYSILNSDWEPVDYSLTTKSNLKVISTSDYIIEIDTVVQKIRLLKRNGTELIREINLHNATSSLTNELGVSLNKEFSKLKKGGGIIGSDGFTGETFTEADIKNYTQSNVIQLSLDKAERLYGGGASSRNNIQHRGEVLRMWATYQKTEIITPYLMSSKGWGIFVNTTTKNYFDVGRFQSDNLLVYDTQPNVDFYLMIGDDYYDILQQYVTITGKPYLMPKWAYGLAFGGNIMENQMNMMENAVHFREKNIPCDIFWIEPQWMDKHYDFSTEKGWNYKLYQGENFWEKKNPKKYENPLLFISRLKNMGFKLALWLNINHDYSIVEEDSLALKEGKPVSGKNYWFPHLTKFIDQGVVGFKIDPCCTLDHEHPDREYHNGAKDAEMHNLNQVLMPKQMLQTLRGHNGLRSFHHYCGGYAGTQHWGAATSGDNGGAKEALFDQLNLGMSGFMNTSLDVLNPDNKDGAPATIPALHLGFLIPWVQVNSWYALHHPWYLPPLEKEVFTYYAQLRNKLNPYIYSTALEGSQTGKPILRAMPLEFPNDRKVDNMIFQYMLGPNLLVGVFSDSIYLPQGKWINYWNGEKFTGGKTVKIDVPVNRGGLLFVKSGAILPSQKLMQYVGEQPTDTLIIDLYPDGKSSFTLYEDDGVSFEHEKGAYSKIKFTSEENNKEIHFTVQPSEGKYKNMHQKRTYLLNIRMDKSPATVKINDKTSKSWNYKNGILQLVIKQADVSKAIVLSVKK